MSKITKAEKKEYQHYREVFESIEEELLAAVWLNENFSNNKQVALMYLKVMQRLGNLVQDFYKMEPTLTKEFDAEALKDCLARVFKKSLKEKDYNFWDKNYNKLVLNEEQFFSQDLPLDIANKDIESLGTIIAKGLNSVIYDIQKKYKYDFKSVLIRNIKWFILAVLLVVSAIYYNLAKEYETYNFLKWKAFDSNWNVEVIKQDWGSFRSGKSVGGNVCTIAGKTYKHCYGTHAVSKIKLTFAPNFTEFSGACGVDNECSGTVNFKITDKDNKILFDSGVMNKDMVAKEFKVPVNSLDTLYLNIEDGENGISCDHADWVDLKLE